MPAILIDKDIPTATGVTFNNRYVSVITVVVALGGVLFGFDLSIISGTVHYFRQYFSLDAVATGWSVGCINLGAALGALAAGRLADRLGRRRTLLLCAVLFAVSGAGTGWSTLYPLFILFRMMSGVAIGAAALACPVYIAEIAPASLRGRLVTFYQLAITSGILIAYLSNYLLLNTGVNNWRWMFTSQSFPALFFFFGLLFISESPRWLIRKHRTPEALRVLTRIGGPAYATTESAAITASFALETKADWRELFRGRTRYILVIGILIAIFSQAGGQNSLLSYAPEIFKQAGVAENSAFLQSVLVGVINLLLTFVAIGAIDRTGRKRLLLYGAALLALDAAFLAGAFYRHLSGMFILSFVLAFIGIYAATLGPVTWVILSEIFPNRVRGYAMSMATLSLWVANFFTTALFPVMQLRLGLPATFSIHAAICLIYFFFVRTRVPETKNRSLEQIESQLTGSLTPPSGSITPQSGSLTPQSGSLTPRSGSRWNK